MNEFVQNVLKRALSGRRAECLYINSTNDFKRVRDDSKEHSHFQSTSEIIQFKPHTSTFSKHVRLGIHKRLHFWAWPTRPQGWKLKGKLKGSEKEAKRSFWSEYQYLWAIEPKARIYKATKVRRVPRFISSCHFCRYDAAMHFRRVPRLMYSCHCCSYFMSC